MKLGDLNAILADEFAFSAFDKDDAVQKSILVTKNADKEVRGIAYDSRKVEKDFLFVAAYGARADGHEFIPDAVEKGACAVVVESHEAYEKYGKLYPGVVFVMVGHARIALALLSAAFFGYPAKKLTLIGITGTKGKTSTSFMIAGILNKAGKKCGIVGTTGVYYGDAYEPLENSTPESYELHRIFAEMVKAGMTHCVMEVSSQALMMHRVHGIRYDTAVFTNISPDHIGEGEHKSFEEYLSFKGRLFTMCDRAAINLDNDHTPYILDILKSYKVPTVTFSCKDKSADYYGDEEKFFIDGGLKTEYTLHTKDGLTRRLDVMVPGRFSVYNSLCAVAATAALGATIDDAASALLEVKVIGRTEPVKHPKCTIPVLIDYAHNALSMESLIMGVKAYNPAHIICVFGAGGNRSRLRRYDMGEISGKYADLSVITADNPRYEELDDIISDILVGIAKTDGKYTVIKDRKKAIFYALEHAGPDDIVLLCGKGQETYQEIQGVRYPFNEREIVKEYYDTL